MLGLSAATIWAGAALLITLTGGRLGREDTPSRRRTDEPARPAERELAHA